MNVHAPVPASRTSNGHLDPAPRQEHTPILACGSFVLRGERTAEPVPPRCSQTRVPSREHPGMLSRHRGSGRRAHRVNELETALRVNRCHFRRNLCTPRFRPRV